MIVAGLSKIISGVFWLQERPNPAYRSILMVCPTPYTQLESRRQSLRCLLCCAGCLASLRLVGILFAMGLRLRSGDVDLPPAVVVVVGVG